MSPPTLSFDDIENSVSKSPAMRDKPDARDFIAGAILQQPAAVPNSFDLRPQMNPTIKNQGIRDSCTAFATAAVSEYFYRAEWQDPTLDLSEEYLFCRTKQFDVADYGFSGSGAYMRSAAKAIQKYGTCKNATMPYQPDAAENVWQQESLTGITADEDTEAQAYRCANYASVDTTLSAIQTALIQSNAPLIGGFTIWSSYRTAQTTGLIPAPAATDTQIGGHAMAIVGYTDSCLILRNSWGAGWGDAGYLYWPLAALDQIYSIWSFIDYTNPNLNPTAMINANLANVPSWALASWNKAIAKNIVQADTKPQDVLTKAEYMVLLDRMGQLG